MSLENNQQIEEKSSDEKLTPEQLLELSVTPEINPRTGKPLKPKWLKSEQVQGERLYEIKRTLREGKLFTVCEEARCPNISECWNSGTATFMILGDTCTRGCRFCAVKTGNPAGLLDANEPMNTALNIKKMNLDYAVITMVDRDDLPDGGAAHIAQTVSAIQSENPGLILEILAGDFQGREEPLREVLFAGQGVDVFAHNLETVRRLSPRVRDARAKYDQSLRVLENAKKMRPQTFTKSALMLGLGEEAAEIEQSLRDMRAAGVEIVTIGQYLQPSNKHLSIKRFVHPDEFKHWNRVAEELGFKGVASGPLVRSSYKAAHLFPERARVGRQDKR
ncbi:MAG: lipoyl synthase [Betaproteobacteria bacterium]|nr:lipoyl synthase [Betaproteobacteria bacterium]